MRLVFATNNAHKLAEARAILPYDLEIVSLRDIGCNDDIPETSDTLDGNSLQKAQYIFDKYGVDCFADDTGLEVDALGGHPGVRTARYAGEPANDANNRAKLLNELSHAETRAAHFRTAVTLILNGQTYRFEGRVNGTIATEQYGDGGFGYDPIFIPEGYDKTFAQLPAETKNSISHRADALKKMNNFITSL